MYQCPRCEFAGGFDPRTSGRTLSSRRKSRGWNNRSRSGLVLPVRFSPRQEDHAIDGAPLRHVHTHQSVGGNIHLASWYWLRITLLFSPSLGIVFSTESDLLTMSG